MEQHTEAPEPPRVAHEVFGERLPLARRYAAMLADTGVSHGLIGPREAPRLWDRHILNCAVVETLLPHRTRIIDVGSGAGLPGLVMAIVRPDLDVVLVEPMRRRTDWLESVVDDLSLRNVTVLRGRAQDFHAKLRAPVVTARAVARLKDLLAWSFPLLDPQGRVLAVKGASAERELAEDLPALRRFPVATADIRVVAEDLLETPTRVIDLVMGDLRGATPRRPDPAGRP